MIKDYDKLIQDRVDHSFNTILGVTSVTAFIAGILLFMADLPKIYSMLNLSAGVITLVFFCLANRVKTSAKIMVTIMVTLVIAIASFIGGSFTSAFLSIFIISNIIAVLFLPRKYSIMISVTSILMLLGLAIYSTKFSGIIDISQPFLTWSLQILGFILLVSVLNISSYTIKNFLIENINGLEEAIIDVNYLAYYDQLTHLPNTYKFKEDVKKLIEENKQDGFVLFFNLKSLNLINSTLGNEFGDQALIEAAEIFNDMKRNHAIVARIGGNEFAMWIDQISETELHVNFSHILNELKSQSIILKKKLEIYASLASFEYGADSFEECYQRATLTLTYVKNNNILELVKYNDEVETILRRKESIKDLIEEALNNKEITLYYQAQYDSRDNTIIGVEALARWNSKYIGFVSPGEFIPVIESLNMSVVFGNYVIDRVCSEFENLEKKYNKDIDVSINISPSHLMDSNIVETMKTALGKYGVPPQRIILEITEDIIIKGLEEVKLIIRDLKAMELKISLDDFGSGYSSLNYLAHLELDEIKIDKSFIDQIEQNERTHILLENIIQLSEKFNLVTIAEGVETKEQNEILAGLGCYIIQGYYFAKPEQLN